MIHDFKKISNETVYETPVFDIVKKNFNIDGKPATHPFYTMKHDRWVNTIAITEDQRILMIKQYRTGLEQITLEIPGGVVEPDEDTQYAAERETLEETGYQGDTPIFLGKCAPNPAIQTGYCYSYLLLNCKKVKEQNLDDNERIEVLTLTQDEIQNAIAKGEISHALVITAFYYYFLYQKGFGSYS